MNILKRLNKKVNKKSEKIKANKNKEKSENTSITKKDIDTCKSSNKLLDKNFINEDINIFIKENDLNLSNSSYYSDSSSYKEKTTKKEDGIFIDTENDDDTLSINNHKIK